MKKKFWLLLVLITFSTFAKAEDGASGKSRSHVHFILFGGFNSSRIVTDFNNKQTIISEAKNHYNFGACFRFEIGRHFFLQPEVYFTRKGGLEKSFHPIISDSFDQEVNVQSLDVPIMVGFRFFHSEKFTLRMYGGPVLSFLQDQTLNISKNGQELPHSDINIKTKTFSMQLGAGVDITRRFTFDVRYEYALSPILKISDLQTSSKIIYFTVGLKLF
jgi:hypothetical protein